MDYNSNSKNDSYNSWNGLQQQFQKMNNISSWTGYCNCNSKNESQSLYGLQQQFQKWFI